MAYKMKSNLSGLDRIVSDESTAGTPIFLKKLEEGIVAEANKDGSIFLDPETPLNKAKEAISHEKVHIDQMDRGDLDYDDKNVYWKGKLYNRKTMNEGSKSLPWEKEAYKKQ
jgi:hypothetical protein|tara:strand:+ start:1085 stop:1420 length:336 start_codon:yes stop_codon:yes gene_type:complete